MVVVVEEEEEEEEEGTLEEAGACEAGLSLSGLFLSVMFIVEEWLSLFAEDGAAEVVVVVVFLTLLYGLGSGLSLSLWGSVCCGMGWGLYEVLSWGLEY